MKIRIIVFLLLLLVISCEPDNQAPVALFVCSPPEGNINTLFDLDAGTSVDPDGLKNLLVFRWDYNGDGVWDTPFGPYRLYSCRFPVPGSYIIRLEVKDTHEAVTSSVLTCVVDSLRHVTDPRDGQVYPAFKLGSHWWMGRNLNIGRKVDPSIELSNNGLIEKYVYPAEDPDSLNGGLYTWSEMMAYGNAEGSQGICPPGWHIPADGDWRDMLSVFRAVAFHHIQYYQIWGDKYVPDQTVFPDNYQTEGAIRKLLRETGSTGFDAVLLGYRNPDGVFGDYDYHYPGKTATFWSSTVIGNYAIRMRLYQTDNQEGDIIRLADNLRYAFSVRCVTESL